jgi:farnesyl-diphosphate farnesyltransferase
MATAAHRELSDLLKAVSRSFYLTLRILPGSIRPQIGLAYLLARATDTVADTDAISIEQRLAALQDLRSRILRLSQKPLDFGQLSRRQASAAERVLLETIEDSLGLLQTLSPEDLKHVREVLGTITSGQELDLRRFSGASVERIVALNSDVELDDYTYRVAGSVGEFWTRMCRAHLFPGAQVDDASLLANGVRFGKGLQLVNILRDLPADLQQGRCYLPADRLSQLGLRPFDLLKPANETRMRPLFDECLGRAEAHLRAGWDYTNALPPGNRRVRLACAWPILFGLETLKLLRTAKVLDAAHRVKVNRKKVRQIQLRSMVLLVWPRAWKHLVPAAAENA